MNASQVHLALTHVPVMLSLVGLVILVFSLFRRNDILIKTSFYILTFAAVFALPVYFSGEGAEEVVEHLPGVSENIIEQHEDLAKISLAVIIAAGLGSLAGLIFYDRRQWIKLIKTGVVLISLVSAVLMAQTAHLGGQIRHAEIRSGFIASNENEGGSENEEEEHESKSDTVNQQSKLLQDSCCTKKEEKENDD